MFIDDGDGLRDSVATLSSDVTVNRVLVSSGDTLSIDDSGILRIPSPIAELPDSGSIGGDGVIELAGGEISAGALSLVGSGSLRLSEDGEISSGTLSIGESYTLRGAGGAMCISRTLENFGTVEADLAAPLVFATFGFPCLVENHGTMRATGAGGIDATITANTGEIRVSSGSTLVARGIENDGQLIIEEGGSLSLQAAAIVVPVVGLVNDASTVLAGQMEESVLNRLDTFLIEETGIYAGFFRQQQPSAVFEAVTEIRGEFRGNGIITDGRMVLDGGRVVLLGDLTIAAEALLEGDGSFEGALPNLRIFGAVSPGQDDAGFISVEGDVDFFPGAELHLDLVSVGLEHDQIDVLGQAFFDGAGVVLNAAALAPTLVPGDRFDVLTAGEIVEQTPIAVVSATALPNGLSWATSVVEGAEFDTLQILVVPEPGSALLGSVCLAFLAQGSRRRRAPRARAIRRCT